MYTHLNAPYPNHNGKLDKHGSKVKETNESRKVMNYDQRLSTLNLEYLSVHLDVTCLKYIDTTNNTAKHPLSKYIPEVHTTRHIVGD